MPSRFVATSDSACVLRGQPLTNSECNVLFSALSNLIAPLEINMEGAAASAGLKPNSYKEMYRQLKKRGDGTITSFTPKKRTAADADADGAVMEESPAKKKAATPRKPRMTAKMKREAEAVAADDGYATAAEGGVDDGEI
ncbi:hypothetical protein QBC32DRAFT_314863 [Pseudoneurospora amorphoporcata]|uniref:Uncharacterized protein n=1 Tax=Pseudoneurospora amorphoporcata TaxID=241081 RepID=A0AAN6NX62_9PEZI|nr:hypothetical protein QBC32DRAFT_314863 [Pseudoneurospora amorphoporcata]